MTRLHPISVTTNKQRKKHVIGANFYLHAKTQHKYHKITKHRGQKRSPYYMSECMRQKENKHHKG